MYKDGQALAFGTVFPRWQSPIHPVPPTIFCIWKDKIIPSSILADNANLAHRARHARLIMLYLLVQHACHDQP
jgi:hypothetical protein